LVALPSKSSALGVLGSCISASLLDSDGCVLLCPGHDLVDPKGIILAKSFDLSIDELDLRLVLVLGLSLISDHRLLDLALDGIREADSTKKKLLEDAATTSKSLIESLLHGIGDHKTALEQLGVLELCNSVLKNLLALVGEGILVVDTIVGVEIDELLGADGEVKRELNADGETFAGGCIKSSILGLANVVDNAAAVGAKVDVIVCVLNELPGHGIDDELACDAKEVATLKVNLLLVDLAGHLIAGDGHVSGLHDGERSDEEAHADEKHEAEQE